MVSQKLSKALATPSSHGAQTLRRILTPWSVTGPVSDAEWRDVPLRADEYRVRSPGSTHVQVNIPQANCSRVYTTRYFTRDSRRHNSDQRLTAPHKFNLDSLSERNTAIKLYQGSSLWQAPRVRLLDDPNAGYT